MFDLKTYIIEGFIYVKIQIILWSKTLSITGKWYEIGKIQTPGGGFWQQDCVCNNMNVNTYNRENGDSTVDYQCRYLTPDGDLTEIQGKYNVINFYWYTLINSYWLTI